MSSQLQPGSVSNFPSLYDLSEEWGNIAKFLSNAPSSNVDFYLQRLLQTSGNNSIAPDDSKNVEKFLQLRLESIKKAAENIANTIDSTNIANRKIDTFLLQLAKKIADKNYHGSSRSSSSSSSNNSNNINNSNNSNNNNNNNYDNNADDNDNDDDKKKKNLTCSSGDVNNNNNNFNCNQESAVNAINNESNNNNNEDQNQQLHSILKALEILKDRINSRFQALDDEASRGINSQVDPLKKSMQISNLNDQVIELRQENQALHENLRNTKNELVHAQKYLDHLRFLKYYGHLVKKKAAGPIDGIENNGQSNGAGGSRTDSTNAGPASAAANNKNYDDDDDREHIDVSCRMVQFTNLGISFSLFFYFPFFMINQSINQPTNQPTNQSHRLFFAFNY